MVDIQVNRKMSRFSSENLLNIKENKAHVSEKKKTRENRNSFRNNRTSLKIKLSFYSISQRIQRKIINEYSKIHTKCEKLLIVR